MSYVLTLKESIEQKRIKLSEIAKRPVYVSGKYLPTFDKNVWIKMPDETEYKNCSNLSKLELILNPVVVPKKGATKVEQDPKKVYFDLEHAKSVYLILPLKEEEIKNSFKSEDPNSIRNIFKHVNLSCEYSYSKYWIEKNDIVPKELEEYVEPSGKIFKGEHATADAIKFYSSEDILLPFMKKSNWHLQNEFLKPPGKYNQIIDTVDIRYNRISIIKSKIGNCVVCHGSSKEEWHIAFGYEKTNCICRKCSKQAFSSWQEILNTRE